MMAAARIASPRAVLGRVGAAERLGQAGGAGLGQSANRIARIVGSVNGRVSLVLEFPGMSRTLDRNDAHALRSTLEAVPDEAWNGVASIFLPQVKSAEGRAWLARVIERFEQRLVEEERRPENSRVRGFTEQVQVERLDQRDAGPLGQSAKE